MCRVEDWGLTQALRGARPLLQGCRHRLQGLSFWWSLQTPPQRSLKPSKSITGQPQLPACDDANIAAVLGAELDDEYRSDPEHAAPTGPRPKLQARRPKGPRSQDSQDNLQALFLPRYAFSCIRGTSSPRCLKHSGPASRYL